MFKSFHKNIKFKIQRQIMKEIKGKGKHHYDPSDDFNPTNDFWFKYAKEKK